MWEGYGCRGLWHGELGVWETREKNFFDEIFISVDKNCPHFFLKARARRETRSEPRQGVKEIV